jgi:hypothetical protein
VTRHFRGASSTQAGITARAALITRVMTQKPPAGPSAIEAFEHDLSESRFILRDTRKCALLIRHGRACPGHPRLSCRRRYKASMPGTSPGMTSFYDKTVIMRA